jgi:TonB family protein
VGQLRLLRFDGKNKAVQIKMQDLAERSGPCDLAVEIRTATLAPGQARLSVDVLGLARYAGQPREPLGQKSMCRGLPQQIPISLSTPAGDSPSALVAEVGRVLLTPEDYLAAHGMAFDRAAGDEPKDIADQTLTASLEEQRIARALTRPAKLLLAVDPAYPAAHRSVRQEGQVELRVVVGADGRLHQPKIITALGDYEARLLRVLPMWRYDPARRGEDPVAVRLTEKAILRLY